MLPRKKTFSLNGAKPKFKKKDEITNVGSHLCAVKGLREVHGFHGFGFFIDFMVLAYMALDRGDNGIEVPEEYKVPTPIGLTTCRKVYPDSAKASGRMSAELAYAREQGKIQVIVAACLGLDERQAEQVDDDVYNANVSVPRAENGQPIFEGRPLVSPLVGKLVIVDRVYYPDGKTKGYYEVRPYSAAAYPHFVKAAEDFLAGKTPAQAPSAAATAPTGPKPAPKLPGKPAKTLSFEEAAAAAGWEAHPDDEAYAYNEKTEEVIEVAELRQRLGYAA